MTHLRVLHMEMGRHMYGGALQVFYLLRGLKEKGIDNILVCTRGSAIAQQAAPFARIYQLPVHGELDPRHLFWLLNIIRKDAPDLVHVHSRRGADLWGGLAARLGGVKAVVTRRVDNPEIRVLARGKYRLYRKVVAISKGIKEVLVSEGIPARKIEVIYSGVDWKRYQSPCDRMWFRRQFHLNSMQSVVGMVAQFIPRKGHSYFIEAIPEITRQWPETKFIFFGKGPLKDAMEQKCMDMGIARWVHFAGFREDIQRIIPCLDVLVHPAVMEGLGVSLLEAAACGVPVIAFGAGGIPEVVVSGKTGLLIKTGDVKGMVSGCVNLLKDKAKAKEMGENAKEWVKKNFSIDVMVTEYTRLYSAI